MLVRNSVDCQNHLEEFHTRKARRQQMWARLSGVALRACHESDHSRTVLTSCSLISSAKTPSFSMYLSLHLDREVQCASKKVFILPRDTLCNGSLLSVFHLKLNTPLLHTSMRHLILLVPVDFTHYVMAPLSITQAITQAHTTGPGDS